MEVNVQELLFTQDSIKSRFKEPRQEDRIDDAVDLILQGKIKVTDFPPLKVVSHEGRLWSLDNRRLWIFKKAKISTVKVKLIPYHQNPRFAECMNNLELKAKLERTSYWPRVRGECRKQFVVPRGARPAHPGFSLPSYTAFDQSVIDAKSSRGPIPVTNIIPTTGVPKHPAMQTGSYGYSPVDSHPRPIQEAQLKLAIARAQMLAAARMSAVNQSPHPSPWSSSPSVQAPAEQNAIKTTPSGTSSRPRQELPSRSTRCDVHVIDIPQSKPSYQSAGSCNALTIFGLVVLGVFILWLVSFLVSKVG